MKINQYYFDLTTKHKEGLIDPNYHYVVDRNVIPKTVDVDNDLTISKFLQLLHH